MATYLILNIIVTVVIAALLYFNKALVWDKAMTLTLGVLLITTAVFDSLIVASSIVAYNPQYILGIYIGAAPIEDFFYAAIAVLIIPNVWHVLGKKEHHE